MNGRYRRNDSNMKKKVKYFHIFWYYFLHSNGTRGEKGSGSINRFNPATLLCPSQTRTWISSVVVSFYVQWFNVTGDCSFCLYWWNCWPSLFKLSSDKFGTSVEQCFQYNAIRWTQQIKSHILFYVLYYTYIIL